MNATVAAPEKAPGSVVPRGVAHHARPRAHALVPGDVLSAAADHRQRAGLTYSQIGLIMTCQYIAGAVANVPGGMLVDTVGRKGVLMALSLFWVGFPYLLMGFSHGYLMLLGCVALVGFGNSLWHPTAIPTLARRFPERKGLVLSLHGMGGNVGDALAPLAVGSLLAILTWREVVIINVIPGLVMSLLLLVILGTLRVGSKGKRRDDEAPAVAARLFPRRPGALQEQLARAAHRELGVPLDDAERAAHVPAGLSRLRDGLLAVLGGRGHVRAAGRGLRRHADRRAPLGPHGAAQHHDDEHGDDRSGADLHGASRASRTPSSCSSPCSVSSSTRSARCCRRGCSRRRRRTWAERASASCSARRRSARRSRRCSAGMIADRYGLIATFWFLAGTIVVANLFILAMPKAEAVKPACAGSGAPPTARSSSGRWRSSPPRRCCSRACRTSIGGRCRCSRGAISSIAGSEPIARARAAAGRASRSRPIASSRPDLTAGCAIPCTSATSSSSPGSRCAGLVDRGGGVRVPRRVVPPARARGRAPSRRALRRGVSRLLPPREALDPGRALSAAILGDALALASATCFAISNVTIARGARRRPRTTAPSSRSSSRRSSPASGGSRSACARIRAGDAAGTPLVRRRRRVHRVRRPRLLLRIGAAPGRDALRGVEAPEPLLRRGAGRHRPRRNAHARHGHRPRAHRGELRGAGPRHAAAQAGSGPDAALASRAVGLPLRDRLRARLLVGLPAAQDGARGSARRAAGRDGGLPRGGAPLPRHRGLQRRLRARGARRPSRGPIPGSSPRA